MPRFYHSSPERDDSGKVVIERQSDDHVEVFYTPSKERLERSDLESGRANELRVRLLCIDGRNQSMTVFPVNTLPSSREPYSFLKPKYSQIKAITIADWRDFESDVGEIILGDETMAAIDEDPLLDDETRVMMVLENLPSCFIKDYDYGLGLTKAYRFIVHAVENLTDCTEITITGSHETGVDGSGKAFLIASKDLDRVRRTIDRTMRISQDAVRSVNYGATWNFFAEIVGKPTVPIRTGRSPLRRSITEAILRGEASLSDDEEEAVLDVVAKNTKSMAMSKPDKLANLKKDIELVTLDHLIERYQEMMQTKLQEQRWQEFLDVNSFILGLAFGYPVVKVRGQASVGGHKLSGQGETIADFLVKNSLTNNCAIIEIKTPQTRMFNKGAYRGEVHAPSRELVGAINQALNQKHNFEREIARIKDNSQLYDIESYSVRCCLVVGTIPSDQDLNKSFELFRGNSKHVEIVTFDELLEKLKGLRDLLTSRDPETKPKPRWDVHLPGMGIPAGSLAGVFRPLIAGPSGSAVSPRLSGWTARPGICRPSPAPPPCSPSTDCQWPPLSPSPR